MSHHISESKSLSDVTTDVIAAITSLMASQAKITEARFQKLESSILQSTSIRATGTPAYQGPGALCANSEQVANASTPVRVEDVMISFRCKSAQSHADALKALLESAGLSVFVCSQTLQAGENYRTRIAQTAALCKVMIPLVDEGWASSGECAYEYNIAIRTNLVTKSRPSIIPVALPDIQASLNDPLQLALKFPLLMGIASNANCVFLNLEDGKSLSDAFQPVVKAVMPLVTAASPPRSSQASSSVVPFVEGEHLPHEWSMNTQWEGYVVSTNANRNADGSITEAGEKLPLELTAILLDDGTFTGFGKDPTNSSQLSGRIDIKTGEVYIALLNQYHPSVGHLCPGCQLDGTVSDCMPTGMAIHGWNWYLRGTVNDRALSGRFSYRDIPYDEMDPRDYWSLWPREASGATIGEWFRRVSENKLIAHDLYDEVLRLAEVI